jgi:hypothetical protein
MGKMQLQTRVCNTTALDSSSCLPVRNTEYSSQDISSQSLGKKHNSTDIMSVTSLLSINSRGTVDPKRVSSQFLCPFNIALCTIPEKGQKKPVSLNLSFLSSYVRYPASNTVA